MTNGNTNEEWLKVIEKAEKGLPTNFTEYKAPGLGTPEFAKCIDHTLLKLDATKNQIGELCEEARKHNFKVSRIYLILLVLTQVRDALSRRRQSTDATGWQVKNQTYCTFQMFSEMAMNRTTKDSLLLKRHNIKDYQ